MNGSKEYTKENYQKDRNLFSIFASAPICLTIISLIGEIVFQSLLTYTDGTYSVPWSMGLLFSSSALSVLTLASHENVKLLIGISGAVSVLFGLLLVILSSYAIKGKGKNLFFALIIYSVDSIVLIPLLILSSMNVYLISLDTAGYVLQIVIHLIFLAILAFGTILEHRLRKYESSHQPTVKPLFTDQEKENH
ncbi:MAG: hypothetical protein WCR56_02660 [Bacilli bacterium]|jgi:hypothetical protein